MKNQSKVILGILVGCILATGVTFYVLQRIYNNKINRLNEEHIEEVVNLTQARDSLQFHVFMIDRELDKYKAIIDSFTVVDEKHKAEIDRLNMKLKKALEDVLDTPPDENYNRLQERFPTEDSLEYPFSGDQVTDIVKEIVAGDINFEKLNEYQHLADIRQQEILIRDKMIALISRERDDLNSLAERLYRELDSEISEGLSKDLEIARLKKALRMWRAGSLGAGAFVMLVLLLI